MTWATRPGHGADRGSDAGAIAANAKVEYDVKPLVTGDGTLDLALIATSTDGVEFSSKEHLNAAKRPCSRSRSRRRSTTRRRPRPRTSPHRPPASPASTSPGRHPPTTWA